MSSPAHPAAVPSRVLIALCALLASAPSAAAECVAVGECRNPQASLYDFGIYEEEIDSQVEEEGVAAGYNNVTYNKRLISSTTAIPGRQYLNFGFRYLLRCEGYNPEEVPVTIRVFHPRMRNPETEVELEVSEWSDNAWTSYLNYHTGFLFNEAWEIVPGDWTISLFLKERKMLEKRFTVSPQSDSHEPEGGVTDVDGNGLHR